MDTITYTVDSDANIHNTSLKVRDVKASYQKLVDLFGEPEVLDSDRSRVLWRVEFSDGEMLTVYDWNDDRDINDVDTWNVGGHNFMAAGRIYDILNGRPILA